MSAAEIDGLVNYAVARVRRRLAAGAAQEDVNHLVQKIAEVLSREGTAKLTPELFRRRRNDFQRAWDDLGELLGRRNRRSSPACSNSFNKKSTQRWTGRLSALNREIFEQAVGAFDWYLLEEFEKAARKQGLWTHPAVAQTAQKSTSTATITNNERARLQDLRAELHPPFAKRLLLWTKEKTDIVKEMDTHSVLNARYLQSRLRGLFAMAVETPCMHEFVASTKGGRVEGLRAMDVAEGFGHHGVYAPTVYFPLTVPEALMFEPTETESEQSLDAMADICAAIIDEAEGDLAFVQNAPHGTPVSRVDEARAARHPILRWTP